MPEVWRGALVASLVAAAVLVAGCDKREHRPEGPEVDERNGRVDMAFDEFGFRADFAEDAFVCASMTDTHPHGFFLHIGKRYDNCDQARGEGAGSRRWIAFWADHNAADYRTLADAHCRSVPVPAATLAPLIDKWRRQGVVAMHCAADAPYEINVSAMSAVRNDRGEEFPAFLYRFSLGSDAEHFEEDRAYFARLLHSVSFHDPK